MTVTPPGDDHGMSTQLRLVEAPKDKTAPARGAPKRRRARTVPAARSRQVRWGADWRLDATARQVGRQGVAQARAALARARRPDEELPRAS